MVSSTREGAELLSHYGWESRWNTRAEHWPLVEDRSVLLDDSMDDLQSEAAFSIGSNRLELGSPVSNLDFIAEEHFQLDRPGKSRSNRGNDEDYDSESGIHIPDVKAQVHKNSPESHRHGHRMKSQTLPLPGQGSGKHHFPFRSHTFRSIALPHFIKDRTKSFEHISNVQKDVGISHEHRSHSFHFHLRHKHKTDAHKHKSDTYKVRPVIKDAHSLGSVDADSSTSTADSVVEDTVLRARSSSDHVPRHSYTSSDKYCKGENITETNDKKSSDTNKEVTIAHSAVESPADVLKIVEPGDDGYKVNTKMEQTDGVEVDKVNTDNEQTGSASQPGTSTSTIKISITDTDLVSAGKKSEKQNQADPDQTSECCNKPQESDNHLSELEQNADQNERANKDVSQNVENVKFSTAEKEESSVRKTFNLKEERSSSSDSSRTSKSRTESFTTDTTTSGLGSYDSGHHGVMEFPSLSPIPSSNSLDTAEVQYRHKEKKEPKDSAHHSSFLRRMSNLTRVPSVRRQSSPGVGLMPSSKYFDFSENAIMYTTARDAIGYATLRNLMKTRTISSDVESDYGLNALYDNMGSMTSINRRPSIDSSSGIGRPSR